jgi:hypothetical protein
MTEDDPYADLKRHRLTPEMVATLAVVPRKLRKRREHFVQFPWFWVERLAKARYTVTYRVALHVLYRHWKGDSKSFTLSNGMVAMEGVARGTKWRALRELEQLKLIVIERRRRKSPRITAII